MAVLAFKLRAQSKAGFTAFAALPCAIFLLAQPKCGTGISVAAVVECLPDSACPFRARISYHLP
jgi:hypothetical protein